MLGFKKIEHAVELALVLVVLILGTLGVAYSVKAYPKVFETQVSLENKDEIKPNEPVGLVFSDPMIADSVMGGLELVPAVEVSQLWTEAGKKIILTPKEVWQPGESYTVKIKGARNFMLVDVSAESSFRVTALPQIISFYPQDGAQDVVFDIEDPVAATFDKSITDYDVRTNIEPVTELVYRVSEDKKKITWIAKNGFQRGQEYRISVELKHKHEAPEKFRKILESTFTTKPLPPKEWEKDYTARLAQARKFTAAKVTTGKYIDVNLDAQILSIFENGKLLDSFLISSGKKGMESPMGIHQIYNKHPRALSKRYGLYMPYWMAIVPSGFYGLHELPEWPNGYKEGQDHLGIPVSHGCVRLGIGAAQTVYNWAEIGTPVIIY